MLTHAGHRIDVEHVCQELLAVAGPGHPGLDSAEAERILLRHASAVTGANLEEVRV